MTDYCNKVLDDISPEKIIVENLNTDFTLNSKTYLIFTE